MQDVEHSNCFEWHKMLICAHLGRDRLTRPSRYISPDSIRLKWERIKIQVEGPEWSLSVCYTDLGYKGPSS